MPQRYKLRLSDGTFLSVDVDGLRAWTHDGAALVQALGSQQWRPLRQVLAEEENAERLLKALIPPKPKKEATPEPAALAPAAAAAPVAAPVEEPGALDLPPLDPPAFATGTPSFGQPLAFGEPAFGDPPPVSDSPAFSEPAFRETPVAPPAAPAHQVLADETSSSSPDINDASLPAIRLKPLEEDSGFRSAWEDGEPEEEEEPRHEQGPLVAILGPLGGFLSRLLTRLAPLLGGFSSRASREEASYYRRSGSSSSRDEADGPTRGEKLKAAWSGLVLKLAEAWGGLTEKLAETWSGLTARLRRSAPEPEADDDDEAEAEPEPEVPRPARAPLPPRSFDPPEPLSPLPPIVPRPASPPKPISQLPVVPLAAAVDEPEPEPEEVYEGEEPSALMGPLWFWTKRVVVLGLLAAAGYYLYLERASWFPKAADVGQIVFKQIDKRARARQLNETQQQALVQATARLPHLTPPTILMVYEQSPLGVMDASEVFQLTREATERGIDKLPPADAEELRALQSELAATLRPPERRRLDEYDEARARRVIFPFENPYAMDLVAKGARALPSEKLVRLRALLQQAIAEGFKLPPADSATSASPAATPAPQP